MRPSALQALALAAVVVVTSGCSADPATTVHALASWAATGAMVGQAWADRATPRAYTTRALERAVRDVESQARELGTAPAALRTSVTPVTERVMLRLRRMSDAVRADERGTVRALADALATDARRLRELADQAAGAS